MRRLFIACLVLCLLLCGCSAFSQHDNARDWIVAELIEATNWYVADPDWPGQSYIGYSDVCDL